MFIIFIFNDICVYLDNFSGLPSECNVIRNNLFSNSLTGFADFQDTTTSLVANNKAFNCDTAFDYSPSHVVSGDLTTFPTEAGPCDNIAISKTLQVASKTSSLKPLYISLDKEKELSQRMKKAAGLKNHEK